MITMTPFNYEKLIIPTIGKVETVKALKETIRRVLSKTYTVSIAPLDRYQNEPDTQLQTVSPNMFYCYVDIMVYRGWCLGHESMEDYDVKFEEMFGGVIKVTVYPK